MNKKMITNVIFSIALVVFVGVSILIGFSQITVTKVPKKDKITQTVIDGVLTHMNSIGTKIHSAGTKENDTVKDYITGVLDQVNVPYTVESFEFDVDEYAKKEVEKYNKSLIEYPELEDQNKKFLKENNYSDVKDYAKDMIGLRNESKVTLNNILAVMDSPISDNAVLFVTHYDSRPDIANASNTPLAIASFLEAINHQLSRNSLNTDLYFLFTDGKEIDQLGSKEFLKNHKELLDKVQVVLNFDSQGTKGPLVLYETSKNDRNLLKEYKAAVSKNTSYSFLTNLCKLLPLASDFKVFDDVGLQSMNFTMLGSANTYSRNNNTTEAIDKDSVYGYAKTVDQFVSHYAGNRDLIDKDSSSSVYFNIVRGKVITLPRNVVTLLTYLTSILAIGVLVVFKYKKQIRFRSVARSTIFSILAILLTGLIAAAFVGPQLSVLSSLDTKQKVDQVMILFAGAMVFAGLCTAVFTRIAMKRNKHQLSSLMGLLPIPLTMPLVLGEEFVSLSYLFTITTWGIFAFIVTCIVLKDKPQVQKWVYLGLSIVFGLVFFMLFTPIVYTIYNILPLQFLVINVAICCIPLTVFAGMMITVYKSLLEGNN